MFHKRLDNSNDAIPVQAPSEEPRCSYCAKPFACGVYLKLQKGSRWPSLKSRIPKKHPCHRQSEQHAYLQDRCSAALSEQHRETSGLEALNLKLQNFNPKPSTPSTPTRPKPTKPPNPPHWRPASALSSVIQALDVPRQCPQQSTRWRAEDLGFSPRIRGTSLGLPIIEEI